NIMDLEWLYLAQVERQFFPDSYIVQDPFLNAKYSPNGFLYMRHFSGFANFVIFIFINVLLFYFIVTSKKKYTFLLIFIFFLSFHPVVFLWSSRTILFSYFGSFFISLLMISFLRFKNKYYLIFLFILIYAIIVPIIVINLSFFGLKKNYIDDFKYLFSGPILRFADAEELICPFKRKVNSALCEELFVENNYVYLKLSDAFLKKNNNQINIKYKSTKPLSLNIYLNNDNNISKDNLILSDYYIELNKSNYLFKDKRKEDKIEKYLSGNEINSNNLYDTYLCDFTYSVNKKCITISKNGNYHNLDFTNTIDKYSYQDVYIKFNVSELFTAKIEILNIENKNIFSIIPKINNNFYLCSIKKYIYSQENINLECENEFDENQIIYKNDNNNTIFDVNNLNNITLYNNSYYYIYSSSIFNRLKKLLAIDFFLNLNPKLRENININLEEETSEADEEIDLNKIPEGLANINLRNYKPSDAIITLKIDEPELSKIEEDNVPKIEEDNVPKDSKNNSISDSEVKIISNPKSSDPIFSNFNDVNELNLLDIIYLITNDKKAMYGTNSYLNNFANVIISKLDLSYYQYYFLSKAIMKTESDMPIINFFHEYGLFLVLFCFLFFLISIYICINLFFISADFQVKLIAFFSLISIILTLIGALHLNLLFKIEIGYLIFTIIGINSNLYANNHVIK
ncbi:hypothetical protein OAQ39_05030, partial [Alphaproteobacteria bacterium]|nr:hypothetical protein [Alphaproteobacteria bacterium]